jgi:hypothetical protein
MQFSGAGHPELVSCATTVCGSHHAQPEWLDPWSALLDWLFCSLI